MVRKGKYRDTLRGRKALEEITKSIQGLETLQITLPLGNPNLKKVHTNQFLWTDLPKGFKLANMARISKGLNTADSRFSGYEEDRWYVQGITINNNGSDFSMTLDCNPFASNISTYRDAKNSFSKAFNDAVNKKQNNNSNKTKSNNAVASVTGNTSLKGGQGKFIDDLVKKIVGKETDPLRKAKLINYHLKGYLYYKYYCCGKYGTNAEKAYKAQHLNCGDTAMLTTAMMRSAGLDANVVQGPYHFWCVIKINGKEYASDNTSNEGEHCYRDFNQVWDNLKYDSVKGTWCGCEGPGC